MSQPWQLAKAHKPRRSTKPILETLPAIKATNLKIPRDNQTYIAPDISFRFPHINNMRINWSMVQFAHSNRVQTFKFKWIKTGFGFPRPAFICECGRPTIKLYFRHQHLGCRTCLNLTYASRVLDKRTRPKLQAIRLNPQLQERLTQT
jgi:hypothetical protein